MKNTCEYRFFAKVDDSTSLGKLFNQVFKELEILRMISSPDTTTVNGWNNSEQALLFYEICLIEKYMHSIMKNLTEWQTACKRYSNEFHFSWKYYALSHRIELIKEFGGEEEDYNEDGSIRTDLSDDELINDTIVIELADPYLKSIFLSTTPMNCLAICYMIVNTESNSIFNFFKEMTGKPLKTYRRNENGEFIENDWADEVMQKSKRQLLHENIAVTFWSVLSTVRNLIDQVEKLPKTEDNKEFFQLLPQKIEDIFNLKIPLVELPKVGNMENI